MEEGLCDMFPEEFLVNFGDLRLGELLHALEPYVEIFFVDFIEICFDQRQLPDCFGFDDLVVRGLPAITLSDEPGSCADDLNSRELLLHRTHLFLWYKAFVEPEPVPIFPLLKR
jgi:hypothetical protein